MCGVMMQFFAFSRGLSARMGSVETTSSPAKATLPLFRASARSCSTTICPRLLLRMITPSFILAMFSLLMMPTLKSAKGIWSASTSDRANRPSRSTNSTPRSLAA